MKKQKKGCSTQELIGIKTFTKYGLKVGKQEMLFFLVQPTNISVLSPENIEIKVHHLQMVLSALPDIEIVCTDSCECFDDNRYYIKDRIEQETNTKVVDGGDYSYRHYDDTRYHALNLHSVFNKGTIEFRLFNSTLHAGEIKSYIQLCLAISHQALVQKSARKTKTQSDNEKYTFRTWLLRLGLIGDEFKTARHHLLKNLDGNIAWKDPSQAERQKERLAALRNFEQEPQDNGEEPEENTQPEPESDTQDDGSGNSMRM